MKNLLLGLLLIVGVGAGFFIYYYWQGSTDLSEKTVFEPSELVQENSAVLDNQPEDVGETVLEPEEVLEDEEKTDEIDEEADTTTAEELDTDTDAETVDESNDVTLPAEFKLKVAFSTQAPTENWDMPYQEACEEASLIMAYYYFADKALSRPIMNEEILKLVKWEEDTFGYYKDTTLAETARIAEEYFNLEVAISEDVTVDNLKRQVYAGNLVILPFAGRLLENPYFSGEGPLFHMAVLKGWDSKNFIMNDPGLLRLGENFKYSYTNLLESVHDWNGGNVLNGKKVMLVVKGLKK